MQAIPSQNLNERIWHGRRKFKRSADPRSLYSDCNELPDDEILKRPEERTRSELRHGLTTSGKKWTKCGRPECDKHLSIGAGPMWRVSRNIVCKQECASLAHDAWARSQPVGEEAV